MMIKSQKSDFICPFLPGKRDIPIVLKTNEFYENCQEQFLLMLVAYEMSASCSK